MVGPLGPLAGHRPAATRPPALSTSWACTFIATAGPGDALAALAALEDRKWPEVRGDEKRPDSTANCSARWRECTFSHERGERLASSSLTALWELL